MYLRYGIERHGRKPNRKPGYDYSSPGFYFLTICSHRHECIFGEVRNNRVNLNDIGWIVHCVWQEIPGYYPNVALDEFVIMPDHMHGIIQITNRLGDDIFEHKKPVGQISVIVKSFKTITVKQTKNILNGHNFKWQRSFHDHIIRTETELSIIRKYIRNNPTRWKK